MVDSDKLLEALKDDLIDIDVLLTRSAKETFLLKKELMLSLIHI